MAASNKVWNYKNKQLDPAAIRKTAETEHIPQVVAAILLNRGIKGGDIRGFLTKSMNGLKNPLAMTDMEKAADRIIQAVNNKEKIVIYGDYDVDGITSVSLLYSFLLSIGADAEYYIPDRYKEGYGVNITALNRLIIKGAKLLITVDCGITSVGEVEFANLQKLDVIITDHHTCKERLPNALAVVNPKRPESGDCFKELAGVGVAFKLALAVTIKLGGSTRECFDKYVGLAAIGTVADVVPLLGENRIIVDRGLKMLAAVGIPGVNALIEKSGSGNQSFDSSMVSFLLSPRINAAGRILNAKRAVELLLAPDIDTAYPIAEELNEANRERQRIEQKIFDEAVYMIESDESFDKKRVIVLAKEDWHQGVIGIVASRILEKYYKPTILISFSGKIGKGSGRSTPGMNLFDALTYCEDTLIAYGGHAAAAGMSVNIDDIAVFTRRINEYAAEHIGSEQEVQTIDIDCGLRLSDVTVKNAKMLERLEPYGMANSKPVFAARHVKAANIQRIGADGSHLRAQLTDGRNSVSAIGFRMGDKYDELRQGAIVDAAFQMDINSYMGRETAQMVLKDIRFAKE